MIGEEQARAYQEDEFDMEKKEALAKIGRFDAIEGITDEEKDIMSRSFNPKIDIEKKIDAIYNELMFIRMQQNSIIKYLKEKFK